MNFRKFYLIKGLNIMIKRLIQITFTQKNIKIKTLIDF